MTREQAALADGPDRLRYAADILKKGGSPTGVRWYADNTREPIRDETLRDGLVSVGAVFRREDLPTTSGRPRYALKAAFAALFDPVLDGVALEEAIAAFQATHLSKGALARVTIIRSGAAGHESGVLITFPNGESRQMAPGPSSVIAKAVVEVFAPRFLKSPALLWLSESGAKVVLRDDQLALKIGLRIEADKTLPDMILVDLAPEEPLIIFVEVVATDGPITEDRKAALYTLTDAAGFDRRQIAFLTAYLDREASGFRKTIPRLAWNSVAWFASEPDKLLMMVDDGDGTPARTLTELLVRV
jgi:hypothetical protein